MTPEEKRKRYDYAKNRRHDLSTKMREAGIIGAPRPKMSEEEKQAKRKEYSKNYRSRIFAEAKAYEELQKQGTTKVSRRRKLVEE